MITIQKTQRTWHIHADSVIHEVASKGIEYLLSHGQTAPLGEYRLRPPAKEEPSETIEAIMIAGLDPHREIRSVRDGFVAKRFAHTVRHLYFRSVLSVQQWHERLERMRRITEVPSLLTRWQARLASYSELSLNFCLAQDKHLYLACFLRGDDVEQIRALVIVHSHRVISSSQLATLLIYQPVLISFNPFYPYFIKRVTELKT